ncbi:hypothetical protein LTR49_028785, partial [Elasticomyces elasticus]
MGEDRVDKHRVEVLERLTEQGRDTSSIDKQILRGPSAEYGKPTPKTAGGTLGNEEQSRPKRGLASPALALQDRSRTRDNEPPAKRARQDSPTGLSRQVQGVSRQIDSLTSDLSEIRTLLL